MGWDRFLGQVKCGLDQARSHCVGGVMLLLNPAGNYAGV